MKWSFRERKKLSTAAFSSLLLATAAALLAVAAGLGSRLEWWHFGLGFNILRWSVYVSIAAILLALLGLYASRPGASKRGLARSLLALIISIPVVIVPLWWMNSAKSVPPIHDISTDLLNPPQFDAVMPLRAGATNSAQYGGADIAAQQQDAYPDIQPLEFNATPPAVFNAALHTARKLGWYIVAENQQQGLIEATDSTFWFGFKDDVVIRITAQNSGSRVDIRSLSRVGRSDAGANAIRIRAFIKELNKNLEKP